MTDNFERVSEALSGRYRLERECGAGGMATVFLAEDLKHRRQVAIKVLRPEISAVLGAERFLKEIELTAGLQHPHLLPLFDSGEAGGLLYYVMPFVPSESLRARLTRAKQLSVDEAVRITTQVASALDYAHRRGIIHRDIKPENILLQEGQALIADFGIALALRNAGANRLTETGISLGTPQYMSPEQAAGDRDLDARADIYSLGCVLYEMLAGETPHTGPTVQSVISKLLTDRPRALSQLRPSVPAHVEAAVEVALAKLPADRFTTAAEFSDALNRPTLTGARVAPLARTPTLPSGRAWLRDRRTMTALIVLPLVAGGAVSAVTGLRAPPPARNAGVLHLPLSLQEPVRLRSPWTTGVRLSRDGRRLAYYTGGAGGGVWRVIDLATGASRDAWMGVGNLNMIFSPSGDSVAVLTTSWLQQVHIVELGTGHSTLLADSVQGRMDWNDDGWIYHRSLDGGLRRVRVADGRREALLQLDPNPAWTVLSPIAVPGGRGVIFTRHAKSQNPMHAEIAVLDTRTGEQRSLLRGVEARLTATGHLLVGQADGSLLAVRFDPRSLRVRGNPIRVLEGVETIGGYYSFASFEIADDGTLVYVRGEPIVSDTLLVVGRDGQPRAVESSWDGWIVNAARSRDGQRWAATVHRGLTTPNVWVMSAEDREPRRLTFGTVLDYDPGFLDDGRRIAFSSPRQGKNWDLYAVAFDGSAEPVMLLDRPGDIQSPRFTADGRWVVFCERDHLGQTDVMAHRFEPEARTLPMAATEALECGAEVSPDGRWLAYHSDESGRNEVYVRPFPGAGARLQVSTNGGRTPRWSGRELFYLNARGDMIAVPVVTSPTFRFGAPTTLFALRPGDSWTGEVLSDGREFILIRRRLEAPGQVIMIRNFFDVLRARAGS